MAVTRNLQNGDRQEKGTAAAREAQGAGPREPGVAVCTCHRRARASERSDLGFRLFM